jgi:hypothetical protein
MDRQDNQSAPGSPDRKVFSSFDVLLGLGVLAVVAAGLPWLGQQLDQAKSARSREHAGRVAQAILDFHTEMGRWPAPEGQPVDLTVLTAVPPPGHTLGAMGMPAADSTRPWVDELPVDSWGRPFVAAVYSGRADVAHNGQPGPDDVTGPDDLAGSGDLAGPDRLAQADPPAQADPLAQAANLAQPDDFAQPDVPAQPDDLAQPARAGRAYPMTPPPGTTIVVVSTGRDGILQSNLDALAHAITLTFRGDDTGQVLQGRGGSSGS